MATQKYSGCSLDVFDVPVEELDYSKTSGETLTSRAKRLKKNGDTQFIRRAIVTFRTDRRPASFYRGLDAFLNEVDEGLDHIAQSVGAMTIKHTWGLVKNEPKFSYAYYPPNLSAFNIDSYLLAAEVPIITGSRAVVLSSIAKEIAEKG